MPPVDTSTCTSSSHKTASFFKAGMLTKDRVPRWENGNLLYPHDWFLIDNKERTRRYNLACVPEIARSFESTILISNDSVAQYKKCTDIKIKLLEGCGDLLPVKSYPDDAGYDIKSRVDTEIGYGDIIKIPTGFILGLPEDHEAQIRPRSGLAAKFGITVLNSPGTLDANFVDEVNVILTHQNPRGAPFRINRGDRIAQMVIQKLPSVQLVIVNDIPVKGRGLNGFGSTGV